MLVVSFFFGLFGCSAQANEESLERGLILYMPMDGDLLDRVGHFHGRERNRADPLIFTSKSLFDSQGFAEAIYLDGQKQWIETDQGVDLLAYEEGFTLSLWVRPAEIIEQATGELSVTVPIISSGGRSDWELSMRDRGGFGGTSISFRMTAPITGVNAVDYDPGFPNWGDFNTQDVEVSLVRKARKILPGKSAHFVIRGSV